MKLGLLGGSLLLLVGAVGCVVESDPSSRGGSGSTSVSPAPTASASTGNGSASGSNGTTGSGSGATVAPMLVDVDTNQTMAATPGDGVGVFVEYKAGGTWHVWWTCDTNRSQLACNFTVSVTATSAISNITQEGSAQPTSTMPSVVSAVTTTSASVDGITFNTDAGAVITLDASVDGLQDGSFVFFVQNGKINGGYTGKLTNPLKLEGTSP